MGHLAKGRFDVAHNTPRMAWGVQSLRGAEVHIDHQNSQNSQNRLNKTGSKR